MIGWQYTGCGTVAGIGGLSPWKPHPVDRDRFNGSEDELWAWWGAGSGASAS